MKQLILFFLLGIGLLFSACQTEETCEDLICTPNATCNDGTCECDAGYILNINGLCVLNDPCNNVVCGQDSVCNNGLCAPEPCTSSNCPNGNCVNNVCECETGYSKDATGKCTIAWNAAMQGGWSSSNSCVTGTNSVVVTDRGWNNPKSIGYLENLETDMDDITIEFTSPSEFEILAGTYYVYYSGNTSPVYVESVGVGTMNAAADEVNFTYKVTDQINNFIRTCTVTMTR